MEDRTTGGTELRQGATCSYDGPWGRWITATLFVVLGIAAIVRGSMRNPHDWIAIVLGAAVIVYGVFRFQRKTS